MSVDPAVLVNFVVRNGGTHSVVTLCKALNDCQTTRKTARALGKHESQISRLARQLFARQYVLHPDLVSTFEALKQMEEAEYEHIRHPGSVLPFESPGDKR